MPQSRPVGTTRENLRSAIEMEPLDTDVSFPDALRYITSEGSSQSIRILLQE